MIKTILLLLIVSCFPTFFAYGAEPYRIYKTPQGQSFEGRAVGYEGQTFILSNKSGKLFKVPLKALSKGDQTYLISGARLNRIPKGMPNPSTPLFTCKCSTECHDCRGSQRHRFPLPNHADPDSKL